MATAHRRDSNRNRETRTGVERGERNLLRCALNRPILLNFFEPEAYFHEESVSRVTRFRVCRDEDLEAEREREREKRFVANSHSFVCPDQFEEKLGYEFLLESKLILTFDELLYRGGVGIKIRTISHRHLHPFSEMNFIKDQVGYRWNPPSMFITCNLVYRKKMGKRKRIT